MVVVEIRSKVVEILLLGLVNIITVDRTTIITY